MQLAILGRQAKLGLAELESLVGATAVKPVGDQAALIDGALKPADLGGVIRLARPLAEVPAPDWASVTPHLTTALAKHITHLPAGKLKLGLSVFGMQVSSKQLFATALDLKKAGRAAGRSLRVIPNNAPVLNSAQVLHNQLLGDLGLELLIVKNGATTWLAQTTWVQDIDAYAARDFGRPHRDAFVGMLPPKLAQTMLNLAGVQAGELVLDPFCGTGVVLQEAALRGCGVYGTDVNERMVRFSRDNLAWLKQQNARSTASPASDEIYFEVADATSHTWRGPLPHVVTETYLGQPLSGLPKPEKLSEIIRDCNTIIGKFLRNIRPQLAAGAQLCVAVPAWRVGTQFKHLELLDHLEDLGYNRVRFQHAAPADLVYHRADQIVARELLVLKIM